MERPLLLHSSALSEKEYTAFTAILNDLTSDDAAGPSSHRGRAVPLDVDAKHVSLGETKGWIRGKFGVESSVLDKCIRHFQSSLAEPDILAAPQLFALLRLISHAHSGAPVDRSLVFTQAQSPLGITSSRSVSPSKSSQRFTAPPVVNRRQSQIQSRTKPYLDSSPERPVPPVPTKQSTLLNSPTPVTSNPFRRSLSAAPPRSVSPIPSHGFPFGSLSGSAIADDDASLSPASTATPIPLVRAPSSGSLTGISGTLFRGGTTAASSYRKTSIDESPTPPTFSSTNPFLSRSKSTTGHPSSQNFPRNMSPTSPPLPPRKPSGVGLPPPRHPAPAPPPKPLASSKPTSHSNQSMTSGSNSTSALIRQSLIAAKTAQKAAESGSTAARTWEIIKSSSSSNTGGSIKNRHGGNKDNASVTASTLTDSSASRLDITPPSSTSSLEYVTKARVPSAPASVAGSRSSQKPPPPPLPSVSRPQFPSRSTSPTKISSTAVVADLQTPNTIAYFPPPPESPHSPTPSPALSSTSSTLSNSPGYTRPTRSKSLHNPSPNKSPLPPPPPARRRPESVQVSSPLGLSNLSSATTSPNSVTTTPMRKSTSVRASPNSGHGHTQSLTSNTAADSISSLYSSFKQNTKTMLQQSELDKLVGKAEGGLNPTRGYVSHRGVEGERLVDQQEVDADYVASRQHHHGKEKERVTGLGLDKGTVPHPTTSTLLDSDSDSDGGGPGMDSGEWEGWERADGTERKGSLSTTASAQRRAVQAELDELKAAAQRGEGWSRLP